MGRAYFILILTVLCVPLARGQAEQGGVTERDYRIYHADGTPASMEEMVREARVSEVIFVGESHNDPVAHHFELAVLQGVSEAAQGGRVALSLEMFSRDVQGVVDEYLRGMIEEAHFLADSRPWKNYATDYRPLVEFARKQELDVIAANAPRRYTNRVTRLGRGALEELSAMAREHVAPLPYGQASPAYRTQWLQVMNVEADSNAVPESIHGMRAVNMLDAQSLWDATMAYSIAEYLLDHAGAQVVHMVGSFHVNHHTGIPEHLLAYRPSVRMLVISVVPVSDMHSFEASKHQGLGDFVILSNASLPRTYSATGN